MSHTNTARVHQSPTSDLTSDLSPITVSFHRRPLPCAQASGWLSGVVREPQPASTAGRSNVWLRGQGWYASLNRRPLPGAQTSGSVVRGVMRASTGVHCRALKPLSGNTSLLIVYHAYHLSMFASGFRQYWSPVCFLPSLWVLFTPVFPAFTFGPSLLACSCTLVSTSPHSTFPHCLTRRPDFLCCHLPN